MTGNLNKWKWQRGYSKDIDILTISIEAYCDIYGQIIKTFPFWFFFLTMNQQLPVYIHSMINFQVFRIELVVRYRLKLYHNYIVLDLILMRIVLHSEVLNHTYYTNEKLEWTSFLFYYQICVHFECKYWSNKSEMLAPWIILRHVPLHERTIIDCRWWYLVYIILQLPHLYRFSVTIWNAFLPEFYMRRPFHI